MVNTLNDKLHTLNVRKKGNEFQRGSVIHGLTIQCIDTDKFETGVSEFVCFPNNTMPVALQTSLDIELLIEDSRGELFKKITSQAPYVPPGHVSHKLALNSQASSSRRTLAAHDKPITFCIQDSFLSADGKERLFKVQFGTSECYYCAFEFRDYVVCPAFLVSMFNLSNYACFDVCDKSHYYYIFLSRKVDDPLPIILSKQSKFLGEFKLKLPYEAHRLLYLNPSNKDLKLFIVSPDDEKLQTANNTTSIFVIDEAHALLYDIRECYAVIPYSCFYHIYSMDHLT